MKIFLTGINGQLGWQIARRRAADIRLVAPPRAELDITRPADVAEALRQANADIVVNAAAYTAVDRAEVEKDRTFAINRDAVATLAGICSALGIPLIHVSTDFVFDGEKGTPYVENDPPAPLGIYGASKLAGEQAVEAAGGVYAILRTSWLYGEHGANFVKTILRLARSRPELTVVSDQFGCPTHAGDLADAVFAVARGLRASLHPPSGIFHYCGEGITSWHGFAERIVRLAAQQENTPPVPVRPIATRDYPTPARRPAYSALCCDRIRETFGVRQTPWAQRLAAVLPDIIRNR